MTAPGQSPSLDQRTGRTAAQRTLLAQVMSYTSWANTENRTARTAPGRAAAEARFEKQVDPDGILAPKVRRQRAEAARKAHFARMALNSARARAARKAA
jgi:hypothetical protein